MKHIYLFLLLSLAAIQLRAQVGTGTISPNSMLDTRGSFPAISRTFSGATSLTSNDSSYQGAVSIYFIGDLPSGIRLVNVLGQVLQVFNNSQREYELNGLFPGTYFLQYNINGHWNVRQSIVS